ncbi:MAG TPA: hypothetical protein VE093_02690 [Polyangiaceae bacterium]|jgi:hypothetical protein|nr:hypothetical protein [Polyangiaceae bacterium]
MADDSIYIFHGHYGDLPRGQQAAKWPNGVEHNQSFALAAKTLENILTHWFMSTRVYVRQAWNKDILFRELERATLPIRQVHIMAHGESTQVSLAYRYDDGKRLKDRIKKFNLDKSTPKEKLAFRQWQAEDALVVGYLRHYLGNKGIAKIKNNHARDASWQIWGCYSGFPEATLGTSDDVERNVYFRRFAYKQNTATISGIAVEIAKMLGVTCTAAIGQGGTQFWRGAGKGRAQISSSKERAVKPFWLWLNHNSRWVSYDPTGAALDQPVMFQWTWDKSSVSGPQLPQWLIDAYIY